jgi:putative glycosyltransferase
MRISIVTSLYNSSKFVRVFYEEYSKILIKNQISYEFIFVDDGSPDNSSSIVIDICKEDKNVKLIMLSKNFGQHNAIYAGLDYSKFEFVYVCDVDLEDNPQNLSMMIKEFDNEDLDVVYTVFQKRKGGFVRGKLGGVFYKIFSILTDQGIEKNQSWQRLMRRNYVDSFLRFVENDPYTAGLMYLNGFNQKYLIVERDYKGYTSYNFSKRLTHGVNAIISFSSKPLIFISIVGFLISLISFLLIFYIIFQKMYNINYVAGWSSLILSIWLVGGIILTSIGVVGLYISKIFNQVKNRPKYIVKKIINE